MLAEQHSVPVSANARCLRHLVPVEQADASPFIAVVETAGQTYAGSVSPHTMTTVIGAAAVCFVGKTLQGKPYDCCH